MPEAQKSPWWDTFKVSPDLYEFNAQIRLGEKFYGIHVHLGRVKKRSDGRWNWWKWPHKLRCDWHVKEQQQGVAKTLDEAKAIVEAGFQAPNNNPTEPSLQRV